MRIIPVSFGRTTLPESWVFRGGDESAKLPIALRMFVIETDGRKIAVDAGCDTMPGFDVTDHVGPARALADAGYSPLDITDLIITHAHHDHTECAELYKNARVYIHRDAYDEAKKHLCVDADTVIFDGSIQVAQGVRAVLVGGHYKGSSVVEIDTEGLTYVIAGDECYSGECLTRGIPTGISHNEECSAEFIRKYSDKKYKVIVTHDECLESEYV